MKPSANTKRCVWYRLCLGIMMLGITACVGAKDSELSAVTGTASYRERMALPPAARFLATLERLDAGNSVMQTVASTELPGPLTIPISFSLPYRANTMAANERYQIHARIMLGEKVLFQAIEPYAISAATHSQANASLNLLLKRAFGPAFPTAQTSKSVATELENVTWLLRQLNGVAISTNDSSTNAPSTGSLSTDVRQRIPYLRFQAEAKLMVGFSGCNRLQTNYVVSADTLRVEQTAGTLMACAQGMEQEQAVLSMLSAVGHWQIRDGRLQLLNNERVVVAEFERDEAPH